MNFFNCKDKNGNLYLENLSLVDGLDMFSKGTSIRLTLLDDGRLKITENMRKTAPVYLDYSQITNTGIVWEEEIVEVDKSVVGRAIVGGLLLGSLGAEIGGISGVGKKKKTLNKCYYIINYVSSNSEEAKVLSFEYKNIVLMKEIEKFQLELKEKAGLPELIKEEPKEYKL